jgi:hypothetical protein
LKPHSEEFTRTITFYCELMQEIKIRQHGITQLVTAPAAPAQIIYESSYLQLRIICELIAISCLVIHGDIPATTKKLKTAWSVDQIIKRLSEIHPDFYPHPVSTTPGDKFKLLPVTSDVLTKSELLALYGKCGDRIHRGTVKNVRHHISPNNVSFSQIGVWQRKIVQLLQHHWIKLYDSKDQIGVQMNELKKNPIWNYWAHAGEEK